MRDILQTRGFVIAGEYTTQALGHDPDWVEKVVDEAERLDAYPVFETPDRLIRPHRFHPELRPFAPQTQYDINTAERFVKGRNVYFMVHPDTTPENQAGYQKKRGQRRKGNKGGRPCKLTKDEKMAIVVGLFRKGYSVAEILEHFAAEYRIKLSKSTLYRWLST